jgi:hypothetical protein
MVFFRPPTTGQIEYRSERSSRAAFSENLALAPNGLDPKRAFGIKHLPADATDYHLDDFRIFGFELDGVVVLKKIHGELGACRSWMAASHSHGDLRLKHRQYAASTIPFHFAGMDRQFAGKERGFFIQTRQRLAAVSTEFCH